MKKMLMLVAVLVLLTGSVFAAVELQENGTLVNKSETVNFIGPDVSGNGTVTNVDFRTISTTMNVTGGSSLDLSGDVLVDKSIYLTEAGTMGYGLYVGQPDGGCSRCQVDAAGTTWSCVDVTCTSNM